MTVAALQQALAVNTSSSSAHALQHMSSILFIQL